MALLLGERLRLIEFFKNRLQRISLLQLLQCPVEGLFQQACAVGGQNRFRVELQAADAIRIVTHGHHHPLKRGVDSQTCRNVASDQRVITRHWERVWQPGKHRLTVVFNAGGFTVQDFTRLTDIAAIGFNNRLMAQANPDNWQFAAHTGQQLRHTACFTWRSGAWRKHQHRILHGFQTFNQRLRRDMIAVNHHVVAVCTQLVCQVVSKGVDIIEQQNVSHQKISCA
ncbi:hypothetical protein D3C86_1440760 [compost metagenome]